MHGRLSTDIGANHTFGNGASVQRDSTSLAGRTSSVFLKSAHEIASEVLKVSVFIRIDVVMVSYRVLDHV